MYRQVRRLDVPFFRVEIQGGRQEIDVHHDLVVQALKLAPDYEFSSVVKFSVIVIRESHSEIIVVCKQLQAVVAEEDRREGGFLDGDLASKKVVIVVYIRLESLQVLSLICDAGGIHLEVEPSFFVDCKVK